MNSVLVKVLAIGAFVLNVALAKGENIYKKLEYARFSTDSLQDIQNAIYLYDEIILISKQTTDGDSIRLVAEMERIYLLCNIGHRSEVLKSIKYVETLARRLNDYEKLCDLLCIKGYIYAQLGFKNSAVSVMDQAINSVGHIKQEDKQYLYLGYIYGIHAYLAESSYERANNLLKSHAYFERVSAEDAAYMVAKKLSNLSYASALVEREEHGLVSHYLSNAISFLDPEDLSLVDYFVIINFASLQYENKDFSEVEKWLHHALLGQAEVENNQYIKGSVLYGLYNVMSMKKEYVKAHDYLQKFARVRDSLDKDRIRTISLIEEELAVAREGELLEEKKSNGKSILARSSLTIVLCILTGMLYMESRKNAQSSADNFGRVAISGSVGVVHGEKKYGPRLVQNNELKTLMEQDSPSLPVSVHSEEKNEIALDQNSEWNMLAKQNDPSLPVSVHSEKRRGITVDQINELNALVKQNSPSFMVKFYEYFPSFLHKINELACTPLNNAELEICAYSKLNFSTKDIALYRKDSVRSVENRKYRIRKKLMLSSETDFVVWILGVH